MKEPNNEKELLQFFKDENVIMFQTKSISEHLKEIFNIPKYKTRIWISILKTNGIVKRHSESGYCKTTCASCYEYGCDAGQRPPVNYWKIQNP